MKFEKLKIEGAYLITVEPYKGLLKEDFVKKSLKMPE